MSAMGSVLLVMLVALGMLLAGHLDAEAQQAGKLYRVGYLTSTIRVGGDRLFEAFRQGMDELGWSEGRNVVFEYRAAESRERVAGVAAELVQRKLDVIVISAAAIHEAREATARIPTVFVIADDPVRAGFVTTLARPGGHMTGLTSLNIELDGKRLEILRAALPRMSRVGVVALTQDPAHRDRIAAAERAGRALGLQLHVLEVAAVEMLPAAFEAARRARAEAVMLLGTPALFPHQVRVAELAQKTRFPVISAWREFTDAGGLMSYGTNLPAMFRRAASHVDRILKGANPADLPVEQASTFELVINARAAKALGVTIPPPVLLRADHVLE